MFETAEKGRTLSEHTSLTHDQSRFCERHLPALSGDDLPFTVETFSDEFFSAWRESQEVEDVFGRSVRLGGPISFCYVDGNHSFEFVRRDFENCDKFLEPGGFILFDDSADGSGWEVCRLMPEIQGEAGMSLLSRTQTIFSGRSRRAKDLHKTYLLIED